MDKATIEKLAQAPIEFVGRIAAPGGVTTIFLKAEEPENFCKDPEGYFALQNGATKEEYLQWVEIDGEPRCGATTLKGTRCANMVSGGIQLNLDRWLQEEGGFCQVHGGVTSEEARPKR